MKYSLANYILSIDSNDSIIKSLFGTISIGGEGSYLGSVNISMNSALWSTTGYATGAWVHNKNLDRTGTCTISLNQLSESTAKLIKLCNMFYAGNYNGSTIILSDINGNKVATCSDSFITKLADQGFNDTAADQTWSFTCGKIVFA